MTPQLPLNMLYFYNPDTKLYHEVGTHRTITIEQYEAKCAERAKGALLEAYAFLACIAITIIGAIIYAIT